MPMYVRQHLVMKKSFVKVHLKVLKSFYKESWEVILIYHFCSELKLPICEGNNSFMFCLFPFVDVYTSF